jgi:hypothetical protein
MLFCQTLIVITLNTLPLGHKYFSVAYASFYFSSDALVAVFFTAHRLT